MNKSLIKILKDITSLANKYNAEKVFIKNKFLYFEGIRTSMVVIEDLPILLSEDIGINFIFNVAEFKDFIKMYKMKDFRDIHIDTNHDLNILFLDELQKEGIFKLPYNPNFKSSNHINKFLKNQKKYSTPKLDITNFVDIIISSESPIKINNKIILMKSEIPTIHKSSLLFLYDITEQEKLKPKYEMIVFQNIVGRFVVYDLKKILKLEV